MPYSEALAERAVAISVSESPDLPAIGMSEAHIRDAVAEIARHLLALGARVAYGGDLRAGGFTEILFELVARHRRDADEGDNRPPVLSYLAWPVHVSRPVRDLEQYARDLEGMATLLLLDPQGALMTGAQRRDVASRPPEAREWAPGLTAMRQTMSDETSARIVAGGAVAGFKGDMPGIAQEARIALADGKPLYILGGFGGCAADIAEVLGLSVRRGILERDWGQQDLFAGTSVLDLSNGLNERENRTLASTPHVDEAIALVLRGLLRLEQQRVANHAAHP